MKQWILIQNDYLVIEKGNENNPFLIDSLIASMRHHLIRQHRIGEWKNVTVYSAELKSTVKLPEKLSLISFKEILALFTIEPDWYGITAKAYSIIQWDKNHIFCGCCGNRTKQTDGIFERICTHCTMRFYPRLSPSIIVLIRKGDAILMARGPHFKPGVYALIAGFVEPGESIEEAAHREVNEEIGIQIKNLMYFGSQSWPFPDSLMIGFVADYASGELKIDSSEIEDADWYRYNHLPGRPTYPISIATRMIDDFIKTCDEHL